MSQLPQASECPHGLTADACGFCNGAVAKRRRVFSRFKEARSPDGKFDPEAHIRKRQERSAADEWPPDYDPQNPRMAWNAYNHYGQVEALEVALTYVRTTENPFVFRILAFDLAADGLEGYADA